jgi:hypothetical protein
MIKITLKSGEEIIFDSPKEVAQFVHTLRWRDYQPETRKDLIEKIGKKVKIKRKNTKYCKICNNPLSKGKQSLCGKIECFKEARRRYQKEWNKRTNKVIKHLKINEINGVEEA